MLNSVVSTGNSRTLSNITAINNASRTNFMKKELIFLLLRVFVLEKCTLLFKTDNIISDLHNNNYTYYNFLQVFK